MNTSAVIHFLVISMISISAFGQSSQYSKKRARPTPGVYHPSEKAPATPADPKASSPVAAPEAATPGEKKVDISDLEKKYWVPKDTEFQVVQNRTYTKANRFAATLSVGSMLNENYSSGRIYTFTGNYYMSERTGVQIQYMRYDTGDADMVSEFRNTYRTSPDFGRVKAYYGAAYNWVPVYAKLSLLDQQIIYFDMSITPGLGLTQYDQVYVSSDATKKTAPTFALDIAQHFFLNQNFAIRLDFMNRFFNEEVKNARNPDDTKRTKLNHTVIIQGGITFHF